MSSPSSAYSGSRSAPRRLDWLDALRGWAVFGVVLVHAGQIARSPGIAGKISSAGQYGVQLFFLVSALTISMTYDAHIAQNGRSAKSQFAWFIKRFFRIAPLYYLAALFYPIEKYAIFVVSHHRLGAQISVPNIAANMAFLHTWIPSANNSVVPGGWSIGVEMFFYALVPFIWLLTPIRRRIAILLLAVAGFLAITLLVSRASTGGYYVADNTYLYYWFPAQAPAIVFGLIFYFLYGDRLGKALGSRATALSLAGFAVLLTAALYLGTSNEVAPVFAPALLGIAFVLFALGMQTWLKRVVVHTLSTFLGKISYSVYILHFVVIDFIAAAMQTLHIGRSSPFTIAPIAAITLLITSGLALISKRFVEDPGIAYGHRLSRQIMSVSNPPRETVLRG